MTFLIASHHDQGNDQSDCLTHCRHIVTQIDTMVTNPPVFDTTLSHVIYNVLGMQHDGPFDKAIRTYLAQTITHLLCIPDEDIDGLCYLDDDGNETPLPSLLRDLVWILQCYAFCYLTSQGGPKTLDSKYWASLTAVEFNKFWYNPNLVRHFVWVLIFWSILQETQMHSLYSKTLQAGFLVIVLYGCGLDAASWCWYGFGSLTLQWTSLIQNSFWRIKGFFFLM